MPSLGLLKPRAGGLTLLLFGLLLLGQLGVAPWSPVAEDGSGTTSSFIAALRSARGTQWDGATTILDWDASSPDLAWVGKGLHLYYLRDERVIDSGFDGERWQPRPVSIAGLDGRAVGSPTVVTPRGAPTRMYLIGPTVGERSGVLSAVLEDGRWRLEPGVRMLAAKLTDIDAVAAPGGGTALYALINGVVFRFLSSDGLSFQAGSEIELHGLLGSLEVAERGAGMGGLFVDRSLTPPRLITFDLLADGRVASSLAVRMLAEDPLRASDSRLSDATWLATPDGGWWMVEAFKAQSYGASS